MKKNIIGDPKKINQKNIEIINKTKINNFYINHSKDFRLRISQEINQSDDVLDIGKSMRNFFGKINCNSLTTLDVNEFEDYPDIVFDLCDDMPEEMENRYDTGKRFANDPFLLETASEYFGYPLLSHFVIPSLQMKVGHIRTGSLMQFLKGLSPILIY